MKKIKTKTAQSEKKPKIQKSKKKEKKSDTLIFDFGPFEDYDVMKRLETIQNKNYQDNIENMRLNSFNLKLGDINLRSHRILGGIQNFEYVKKPNLKREFILTQKNYTQIYLPRKLMKKPFDYENQDEYEENNSFDIRKSKQNLKTQNYLKSQSNNNTVRLQNKTRLQGGGSGDGYKKTSIKQEFKSSIKQKLPPIHCFEFEFILSQNIFWFNEPIICYWEPWEESEEFLNLDRNIQLYHLNYNEIIENQQKRLFNLSNHYHYHKSQFYKQKDFSLINIPLSVDIYHLFRNFVIPNLPQNFITQTEIEYDKIKEKDKKPHLVTTIKNGKSLKDGIMKKESVIKINDQNFASPLFPNFLKFRKILTIAPPNNNEENKKEKFENNENDENDEKNLNQNKLMFSEFYEKIIDKSKSQEPNFNQKLETKISQGEKSQEINEKLHQESKE